MSKKCKAYAVIIATKKGTKVMCIIGNEYPNKSDIRMCLETERKQEINKIMNGNSGWRKKENIDKELSEVDYEYASALIAISSKKYKIKELNTK